MTENIRRVVTRLTEEGKSVIVSDGSPSQVVTFDNFPELKVVELWATDNIPTLPVDGSDPTLNEPSFLPKPGGTCFRIVQIAPMGTHKGELHSSDTIEYLTVISGDVWLTLEGGEETQLHQGDFVVQNGTRHAWTNRGTTTCIIAAALLGTNSQFGTR